MRHCAYAIACLAAFLGAITMNGCTLVALNDDVNAREAHVADQQRQLDAETARQSQLHDQIARLSTDLEQQKLTLADLQARLAQLRQSNASLSAATEAQMARKQKLDQQLRAYQSRLNAIAQDPGTSASQKQKASDAIQQQINESLKMMLLS